MSKKSVVPRQSPEVQVRWGVKEIPARIFKPRVSKYAPILEKLTQKPDRAAFLGEFPSNVAISLIVSLKAAAKKTEVPNQYTFVARRPEVDSDQYAVYGVYLSAPPPEKDSAEVKPKRKYTRKPKPETEDQEPKVSSLDAKFPPVDTLK
jgi:hypothetical protein